VIGDHSVIIIENSYWLYDPSAHAVEGSPNRDGWDGNPHEEECVRFGESSWPTDDPSAKWGVGSDPASGQYWKTLGSWVDGGTPDGVNSTFPKLYWEED
jgi:hypothetical protein